MSTEEKVNVGDVEDIVSYYEALTDILREFREDDISYDDARAQLMALNLKSDDLRLGCMISYSVLDTVIDGKEEISYEEEEDPSYQ